MSSHNDASGHSSSHGHGNNDAEIALNAKVWLVGGGIFAIGLSIFLALTDYGLSHSKGEQVLGATLKELRTAQVTMHSRVPDGRQTFDPNHASEK